MSETYFSLSVFFFFLVFLLVGNKDDNGVIIFVIYGTKVPRPAFVSFLLSCKMFYFILFFSMFVATPSTVVRMHARAHTLKPSQHVKSTHYVSFCIAAVRSSCEMSIALQQKAFLGVNINIESLQFFALKQRHTSITAFLRTFFFFFPRSMTRIFVRLSAHLQDAPALKITENFSLAILNLHLLALFIQASIKCFFCINSIMLRVAGRCEAAEDQEEEAAAATEAV